MSETKISYDEEADVLYVSFRRSNHVTGVELADNLLLRLDTGKASGTAPQAVGLTFVSFARMRERLGDQPLTMSAARLQALPAELWQAVWSVVTTPPVSDFLAVELALLPQVPPLPEALVA